MIHGIATLLSSKKNQQQLQQRSAEHALALGALGDGQAKLDARIEELQGLLVALQGGWGVCDVMVVYIPVYIHPPQTGVSAKQVGVMARSFQQLQGQQMALKEQLEALQVVTAEEQGGGGPPEERREAQYNGDGSVTFTFDS